MFIVTDLDRRYPAIFDEVFGDNHIHQKCLFHQNKLVVSVFPKNCTLYQEYIKYKFLNIFYDRNEELLFLENLIKEQESREELGLPGHREWKKEKFQEFREFLHNKEKSRRRQKETLPMNSYDQTLDNLEELTKFVDNDIDTDERVNDKLANKLRKRLEQITRDIKPLTAFHSVLGAPATNNAVENYYSTSLKTNHKKKQRTDEGIVQQLKISALKRANMLDKPPITFIEIINKFRAISFK